MISGSCTINPQKRALVVASSDDNTILGIDNISVFPNTKQTSLDVSYNIQIDVNKFDFKKHQKINVTLYNEIIERLQSFEAESFLLQLSNVKKLTSENLYHLFPSLGFFGDATNSQRYVNIASVVDELHFVVEARDAIFNIGGIIIENDKGVKLVPNTDFDIEISSIEPPNADSRQVFEDKGFHSAREDFPYIKVRFTIPTFVSRIKIRNRGDKWGVRAKFLTVSCYCFGRQVSSHSTNEIAYRNELFKRSNSIGIDEKLLLNNIDNPLSKRERALNSVLEFIGDKILSKEQTQTVLELLSLWSDKEPDNTLVKLELELLSVVVANHSLAHSELNLSPYSKLLKDQDNITVFDSMYRKKASSMGVKSLELDYPASI